ncbi:hypothetical protein DICSQDRAFT_90018 [Dichomitus squalens LYAD-421 SS1]|uniref:YMC020W-like alpha/beta hydrolase domain-containing protein n=1 Tax=Dichomitus squalens (strain LYAD-421) TaxID=732165 RepID=R7SRT1_DICSQ|nr:uncharacterized protein DICSQDRAFT_90018 [Dichomitus squalens LYAD-421 SS1]EJF58899.1 hypothetical protein DICSQDRAFT_90018 [Dichomitus squalens LYAD-421 SS1]
MAVVESQDAGSRAGRKPSVSSLNPSTSRFTLRLPLLGRPKVPLEQAVASAQAEDIRGSSDMGDTAKGDDGGNASEGAAKDASVSNEDKDKIGNDGAPAAPQIVNIIPPTPGTEPADQTAVQEGHDMARARDDSGRVSTSRPASWWDYIGWNGTGHPPDGHHKPSQDSKESEDTNGVVETKDDTLASTEAQIAQPAEQSSIQSPETSTAKSQDAPTNPQRDGDTSPPTQHDPQDATSDKKPSSILSAETVRSHGASWYSPWAWYYSANASDVDATQASGEGPAAKPTDTPPKTDAEQIKADALARDQEQNAQAQAQAPLAVPAESESLATQPERDATPEPSNPIQSSVTENKSGWMSFFMSKALTTKMLSETAYDKQENGMEVMEIDDDEPDPSVAVEVPLGDDKTAAKAKDIQGPSKEKPSPLLLSSSPKPSSPTPSSSIPRSPKAPKSPTTKSPQVPTKEREPKKPEAKKPESAPPLTDSDSIKREAQRAPRAPSPAPSKASAATTPPGSAKPVQPNFVLPTWADTFHTPPRAYPLPTRAPSAKSKLTGALSYVAGALFSGGDAAGSNSAKGKGKGKARARARSVDKDRRDAFGIWPVTASSPQAQTEFVAYGQELPKALDVVGEALNPYILNGGCRVVVIGVAGWSPGAVTRTLAGGLPSSSSKFVNMTVQALEQFAEEGGFKFKKITPMPLEGDGTIRKKVSRVYNHLLENDEWMEDLHAADVIFVASHSQGAVVSTHLLDRLIEDGHILTSRSVETLAKTAASISAGGAASIPTAQAQRVCLLALCGVHLGPLRYLKTSSLLQQYVQYVENAAARELFDFQDTESKVSKNYTGALRNVLDHGAKVVYIASLNDQVVPIYSGLFTAASHPRILRALYIDNDAYHSSDFLSNLLILLIRIRNAGLSDRGLLAHLSEATAGTLNGVGHSTAYEEPATYTLAVKYFFMTNDGANSDAELVIDPFNAVEEQNDYEIPWLLRDMIADNKISYFFAREFAQLRDAFNDWQPKTTILRDVKKKLQPITRLSTTAPQTSSSISKL